MDILELRRLNDITDDEILKYMDVQNLYRKEPSDFIKQFRLSYLNMDNFSSEFVDYFRSEGYAMPFKGISVDDQVNYLWVKIV